MCQVFISYRRDQGADTPRKIADFLRRRLGRRGKAYVDVQQIGAGRFSDALKAALLRARVVLVLVSNRWWESAARLHDPEDWVRQEIEAGLTPGAGKVVLVVYTSKRQFARGDFAGDSPALPLVFQPLADGELHFEELSLENKQLERAGLERIAAAVDRALPPPPRVWQMACLALATVGLLIGVGWWQFPREVVKATEVPAPPEPAEPPPNSVSAKVWPIGKFQDRVPTVVAPGRPDDERLSSLRAWLDALSMYVCCSGGRDQQSLAITADPFPVNSSKPFTLTFDPNRIERPPAKGKYPFDLCMAFLIRAEDGRPIGVPLYARSVANGTGWLTEVELPAVRRADWLVIVVRLHPDSEEVSVTDLTLTCVPGVH